MLGHPHPTDDVDAEMDVLERQHRGLVQQLRMERLGRLLDERRDLAIRECRCGFCGDRLTLWLDNGAVMRLKLLRPQRAQLAALCSVHWRQSVGWVVGARTVTGDDVTCYGWRASLSGFSATPDSARW